MQLLYGRDKSDYKTLSKSKNLSSAAEGVLIRDYIGYTFPKNQDIYTTPEKEPFSISYCVTNLDGYINNEMILVCKNARNVKYLAPSKYAHARLFEIDNNSFAKDFFNIFKYSFVEGSKSEEYKDDQIDKYKGELNKIYKSEILSEDKIKPILYILFDNYKIISRVVYLVIDAMGDDYNFKSLDILNQIYKNIPYFMRKIIGFNSYGTYNQKYSSRIKLVIIDRENDDFYDDYKIDISNVDLEKIKKVCSKESVTIVDYIYSLDDKQKDKFFDELEIENRYKRLSNKDLYNICRAKTNWIDADNNKKIESWIYNIINPNELEEDLFYTMLDTIERDLNEKILNEYLNNILQKPENICINYLDKNKDLYKLLLFEDILRIDYEEDLNLKLNIDTEYICNWWRKKILTLLQTKYENVGYISKLREDENQYEELDLNGFNASNLKSRMLKEIKKEIKK